MKNGIISFKELSPLCVDLDGTLIFNDVIWVSWINLIKKKPLQTFLPLIWLYNGRAYFKEQLAIYAPIDPKKLKYNAAFLTFIKQYKEEGFPLILATAANEKFAHAIADHLDIFDEVIASSRHQNLRAHNKADALVARFGECGFSYAGNSYDDLAVWKHSKHAIGVNLSARVMRLIKNKSSYFSLLFK